MKLLLGDCLHRMKEMDDNSVDSIVTDPPYGLSFMGKKWDYDVPSVEVWRECLRVLKPGGHLLAFAGSRTYHRLVVNVEDAGFEIRDQIMWVYGTGFPKSLNISKAIDAKTITGKSSYSAMADVEDSKGVHVEDKKDDSFIAYGGEESRQGKLRHGSRRKASEPITDEAQRWKGWGTALKPAHEPIVVARKPLIGTVAANVLEHGTGGLNIDGCRIPFQDESDLASVVNPTLTTQKGEKHTAGAMTGGIRRIDAGDAKGRFPANFIHDGSDEAVSLFPESNGGAFPKKSNVATGRHYEGGWGNVNNEVRTEMGNGSAARFFYCAKASKSERNAGLEAFEDKKSQHNAGGIGRKVSVEKRLKQGKENAPMMKNIHPTVKPVKLMEYLCRLVTPPNGVVLDPFMGSGTTGIAATNEGFCFVGIEMDEEYMNIAKARIEHWSDVVLSHERKEAKWL